MDRLDVIFEESQGVRWTLATLWGHYADGTLAILDGPPPSDVVIQSE
ncbi:MAG: hypothetical protein IH867_13395 [Chloroflexi bacterium]|nr:hypothetical protein [Chloroflexota bacterium]